MKTLFNSVIKRFGPGLSATFAVVTLVIVLTMCFTITNVDQPTTATAGERITITLDVEVLEDPFNPGNVGGSTVVFGFLAPTSWNVGANSTVTIASPVLNTNMSLLPPNAPDNNSGSPWIDVLKVRSGIGENYGEVEWVMFIADESYVPATADLPIYGTITIETTVGMENLITQLGYFIGENDNGYWQLNQNWFFYYTPCMEVTGGEGETKNLCGLPPPAGTMSATPSTYGVGDLIKLTFDAAKGSGDDPTRLQGASSVFLCAEATLSDGTVISACDKTDQNEFEFVGEDIWELTIWPKALFNLQPGMEVSDITYTLQNQNGNITVRDPDSKQDFRLNDFCN